MQNLADLPLILALSGDPGGANALAPVIDALRKSGRVRVEARAYRQACAVWQRRGLSFESVDEAVEPPIPPNTRLVLTSTSLNGVDLEKRVIVTAGLRGIPSVTVLDFWSNYRRRFSSTGDNLDRLPDKIAVMDAQAQKEMVEEGFDVERLVATGQPAFDDLTRWRAGFTPERRATVRERFGVAPGDLLVIFASQPFLAFRSSGVELPQYPGYDEHSVAALLVKALEQIAEESQRGITLAIRLHPREEASSFDDLRSERIRVLVATGGDAFEAVCAADLVTGMSTVLLVEACYLGCVVASLQPNLRGPDTLPTNRLGFSRALYSEGEILPAMRELLLDAETRRQATEKLTHFRATGDAAQKVADLVCSLLQPHLSPIHS